jgi:hypothetical protein
VLFLLSFESNLFAFLLRGSSHYTLSDGIVSFDGCGVAEGVGLLIQNTLFLEHAFERCQFNCVTVALLVNSLRSWTNLCHKLGVCVHSSKVLELSLVSTSITY